MAKFVVEFERFEERFTCGNFGCGCYDGCGRPNDQICPELAAKKPELVELTVQKMDELLTNKNELVTWKNKHLFFCGLKITKIE